MLLDSELTNKQIKFLPILKCVPLVGTAISATEAVIEGLKGNGAGCVAKLVETGIGAGFDTMTLASGGLAFLVTSPAKLAGKQVSVLASKVAVETAGGAFVRAVVGTYADKLKAEGDIFEPKSYDPPRERNVDDDLRNCEDEIEAAIKRSPQEAAEEAVREIVKKKTQQQDNGTVRSGNGAKNAPQGSSGGQPPKKPDWKRKSEHETDAEILDQTTSPITSYRLGKGGRVERLRARINVTHVRPPNSRTGATCTSKVRKHIERLSPLENDQAGHIIGYILGGPHNQLYNFFPQHPVWNKNYFYMIERLILYYLRTQGAIGKKNASVEYEVEFEYADTVYPNRPSRLLIKLYFPELNETLEFVLENPWS